MKFKVVYEPDGGSWNVSIPSVRGCQTWGRSLTAARRHIREALSTCVDVLGEDVDRIAREAQFVETFKLPTKTRLALARFRKTKEVAERTQAQFQREAHQVARELTERAHISLRDAGELLGLSHERVNQLTSKAG